MSRTTTIHAEQQILAGHALHGVLSFCREGGYGVAVWREPGDNIIRGIIDFGETKWTEKVVFEEMPSGFLFAPYDRHGQPHFIRASVCFTIGKSLETLEGPPRTCREIRRHLEKTTYEPAGIRIEEEAADTGHDQYTDLISEAVASIRQGEFLKVVPARSKEVIMNNLPVPATFLRLSATYPEAFVSAVFTQEHGLWMGASPELLVRVREGKFFETISLAGTQPFRPDVTPGDITWTQKEIEEQALVSRYIINCFKKIRLREFEEIGPKTVVAGNLIHLRTRFIVDMEATGFPELGTVMLELLHPTSAICGMPLEKADAWLKQHENLDREFFSGYLGPVNLENKTSLFVNLRCMKIIGPSVRFYAGAGVTEDSQPEKEWLETELKMNTLLNVIREHSTDI